MSWETAELECESKYLSWDEGPFEVRFTSEPKIERRHFPEGKGDVMDCQGDGCPYCDSREYKRADVAFSFTVVQYPVGAEKTFRLSVKGQRGLFLAKRRFHKNHPDAPFTAAVFACERSGTGKNTNYVFDYVRLEGTDGAPF